MTTIVRPLTRTPKQVWDFLVTPSLWGLKLSGFKPVPATQFVMEHYPLLGTGYTGECRCEILSVVPERLLEFSMEPVGAAARPTRWVLRFEVDTYLGGSCVVISIFGVDSTRRGERMLLHVARSFIDTLLSGIDDDIKRGSRIGRTSNFRRAAHGAWAERVWCFL